jgi:putative hydrolase of the HAD superfamily
VIFFDLDDTLLDDQAATVSGLDALHLHHGTTIGRTRDELAAIWHQMIEQHFPRYLSGELSMLDQRRARMRGVFGERSPQMHDDEVDAAFEIYLAGYEHGWCCFEDAAPVLSQLSHLRLGIITNGRREQQLKKLERTDLARFFGLMVTPNDGGVPKPHPGIFVEACRQAQVPVGDAIYVGDNWDLDVLGSRAAGMQAIWLCRGAPGREIPADVRVIRTLAALPGVLVRAS